MILNNIDNLYVGSTNALKVYLGSLLIWSLSNDDYDVIPTDITSYTGSKSRVYVIDVDKWYMRTIGGNYKEYGIIASSKSADPYVGELAIDNNHEWEYTSNGWVDLGAYRLPSGYTELTHVGIRSANYKSPYITLDYYPQEATVIDAKFRPLGTKVVGYLYYDYPSTDTTLFQFIIGDSNKKTYWRFYPTSVYKDVSNIIKPNNNYVFKSSSSGCWLNSTKIWSRSSTYPSQNTSRLRVTNSQNGANFNLYYFNISENNTPIHTLVPSMRNSDNKIGLYDTVNGDFYLPDNEATNPFTAGDIILRPKEYDVIPAPVDVIPTDITSYTGSKSCVYVIDVAKWYLRTVGGNYKEYGVVASSKADPYIGELAIIDYHEWEYTATGWVDLGNNSSRLTSDYTELAYVGVRTVSSASPYITLNYYPKEATVIDAKFRPLGGKVVGTLYYAYPSTDTTLFNFLISNGATGQTTYWRFYPTNVKQAVSNIIQPNNDYVFKSESSGCWLNNTKIWSRTGTYPSQNTSQLRVLNSNDGANFNLYYFNITENSTALYTLVPSLRNIDSKIGLYDTVNNTFYLPDNDSTNPLVAGDVLPYPKAYALLPAPTN